MAAAINKFLSSPLISSVSLIPPPPGKFKIRTRECTRQLQPWFAALPSRPITLIRPAKIRLVAGFNLSAALLQEPAVIIASSFSSSSAAANIVHHQHHLQNHHSLLSVATAAESSAVYYAPLGIFVIISVPGLWSLVNLSLKSNKRRTMAMLARIAIFITAVIAITWVLSPSVESVDFSYSGSTGPENWGSLNPSYAACSTGKSQSPINIVKRNLVPNPTLQPLIRFYNNVNATLIDNLYNLELLFGDGVGHIDLDGKKYNLVQIHWHSPSDHTIDGVRYAAELHLVHKSEDGGVSVIAILFRFGNPDPLLSQLKGQLFKLAEDVHMGIKNPKVPIENVRTDELKSDTTTSTPYFRYVGSLTTPPCTENVIWTIISEVREISWEQVGALKAPLETPYKNNVRPTQSLNGRPVQSYMWINK